MRQNLRKRIPVLKVSPPEAGVWLFKCPAFEESKSPLERSVKQDCPTRFRLVQNDCYDYAAQCCSHEARHDQPFPFSRPGENTDDEHCYAYNYPRCTEESEYERQAKQATLKES